MKGSRLGFHKEAPVECGGSPLSEGFMYPQRVPFKLVDGSRKSLAALLRLHKRRASGASIPGSQAMRGSGPRHPRYAGRQRSVCAWALPLEPSHVTSNSTVQNLGGGPRIRTWICKLLRLMHVDRKQCPLPGSRLWHFTVLLVPHESPEVAKVFPFRGDGRI